MGNRILAARADRLWATHKPQSHDLVASVVTAEEQPAQIAAVQVAFGSGGLLSLSRLRLDLESVSILGLGRPEDVKSPAPGRETKAPRTRFLAGVFWWTQGPLSLHHQLFLVLLARQPLHHQMFQVLLVRHPHTLRNCPVHHLFYMDNF